LSSRRQHINNNNYRH